MTDPTLDPVDPTETDDLTETDEADDSAGVGAAALDATIHIEEN